MCLTRFQWTAAKLGDSQARAEFLDRLREARNDELKRLLEYVDYIKQIWALRGLMPALDDKTAIAGTGLCQNFAKAAAPDSAADLKHRISEFLRVCDIAVNLIHKI